MIIERIISIVSVPWPSILKKLELPKSRIRQPKKEKVRNREPER